jgi:hypothetical protein
MDIGRIKAGRGLLTIAVLAASAAPAQAAETGQTLTTIAGSC